MQTSHKSTTSQDHIKITSKLSSIVSIPITMFLIERTKGDELR